MLNLSTIADDALSEIYDCQILSVKYKSTGMKVIFSTDPAKLITIPIPGAYKTTKVRKTHSYYILGVYTLDELFTFLYSLPTITPNKVFDFSLNPIAAKWDIMPFRI